MQVNLDSTARAMLIAVGDRNRSRYVNGIIQERGVEAADALMCLREAGLSDNILIAICDALGQPGAMVAMPIVRPVVNGVIYAMKSHTATAVERHGIGEATWGAVIEQCSNPTISLAIWIIAREYWAGNTAFRGKISG